jgi:uncharacterized C2H2 Zn-finger protein
MDDSVDEFRENAKIIKENKSKLSQISKYLVPIDPFSQPPPPLQPQKEKSTSSSKLSFFNLNQSNYISIDKQQKSKKNTKKSSSKYFTKSTINKEEEIKTLEESFNCPVCNHILDSSNQTDREKHVNKCLDERFSSKASSSLKKEDPSPPNIDDTQKTKRQSIHNEYLAENSILNCPICGKTLHSQTVCS